MKKKPARKLADEVADESRSTQITVAADMVFSLSKNLSGVSFIFRLCETDELINRDSFPVGHCGLCQGP